MNLRDLKPGEEFTLEPTELGDYANPKRVMVVVKQYPDINVTIIDRYVNMHKSQYNGLASIGADSNTKVYIRGVAFHLNRFCQHERMKYPCCQYGANTTDHPENMSAINGKM